MPTTPWAWGRADSLAADHACVALVSRLPLRRLRDTVAFAREAVAVRRQLGGTDGLVGFTFDAHPLRAEYWTLSAWESQEALDAFVGTEPHRTSMSALQPHMGPPAFTSWEVRRADLPLGWAEGRRRLSSG